VEFSRELIRRSGYDRDGFAAHYDDYRPRTPPVLIDALCREARTLRPTLVVDLGAGTGLSTRVWADVAERVIGVEPNPAMIAEARARTADPNVEFAHAFAHETGLDDASTDIATCSQSLHWMEPAPTFAEAARILRPGGVFAAYDYDIVPVVDPEIEAAWGAYAGRRRALRKREGIQAGADRWAKDGHLERLRDSGHFRFCRELVLHAETTGGADEILGLARSLGLVAEYESELGFAELEDVVRGVLGDAKVPLLFGYRVRLGIV
jgi:SAM-dependent methyltransferase